MVGGKVQKVMVQPINLIFRCLQSRSRVQIWLYEDTTHRIEGYIIGKPFLNSRLSILKIFKNEKAVVFLDLSERIIFLAIIFLEELLL